MADGWWKEGGVGRGGEREAVEMPRVEGADEEFRKDNAAAAVLDGDGTLIGTFRKVK